MCSKMVREWLVLLTMEKYMDIFIERGYVSIEHCQQILNSDLIMLGINDSAHRKLLLGGVQLLINSPKLYECSEPCNLHRTESTPSFHNDEKVTNFSQFQDEAQEPLSQLETSCAETKLQDEVDIDYINLESSFAYINCPEFKIDELFEIEQTTTINCSDDPCERKNFFNDIMQGFTESASIIVID